MSGAGSVGRVPNRIVDVPGVPRREASCVRKYADTPALVPAAGNRGLRRLLDDHEPDRQAKR